MANPGFIVVLLSTAVMGFIAVAIIVQRQISRVRKNAARRDPSVSFKELPAKQRKEIIKYIENVQLIRNATMPKLTDNNMLTEHCHAPYIHRMIAVDEVYHEIDAQMERISPEYRRRPEENTYQYLTRLRLAFPSVPEQLVYNIVDLYEGARFRLEKFGIEERMELKSLLNRFIKLVGEDNEKRGTAVVGVVPKRQRDKFGGSDGVRLLAAGSSPFHTRRKSDTTSFEV